MSKASRSLSSAVAAALVLSVSPAGAAALPGAAKVAKTETAHQWGGGYRRRHRDNDIDAGDILTGILIIGGIAAVASAIDNGSKRDKSYPEQSYPDTRYPDSDAYPDASYPDNDYSVGGEDRAVSDCALAAEREASGSNSIAQVRSVDDVRSIDGGYEVRGTIDTRINYRSSVSSSRDFSCDWQNGRVSNVSVN